MSSNPAPIAVAGRQTESHTSSDVAIRAYRACAALAVLVAISYQVDKGLQHKGFSTTDYFSTFTVLSNLFAVTMFLYGTVRLANDRSPAVELLRGAAVVYILTTAIVYALLLSGQDMAYPWVNTIVHRVMPIAVTLDWVIDPPRAHLALRHTIVWMSFPLVYVLYTLTRGAIVDWYPYFFVDPHRHGGYLLVAGDCTAITVGIAALVVATTWIANKRLGSDSERQG